MDLVGQLKNSENQLQEEKRFIEESLALTMKNGNFKELSNQLDNLKHYSQSDNFNNSKLSRLSLFFKNSK